MLNAQRSVILVVEESDDSASIECNCILAQCHRQAADLLALRAQKISPNPCDLHCSARLPVLLKLQRIAMNGQCPGAVILRVREPQQMSRLSAEWGARAPSLSYCLR